MRTSTLIVLVGIVLFFVPEPITSVLAPILILAGIAYRFLVE
ncbi:transporter [Halogeometricum limi]|uniref:Uncharacterized protein n=1 Tax=Halogeometricum limi TaxID=555875 RepID=A0A1I6GL75_9EURY|nr:transporter [Halogeometricum limi]SFR42879.1 hypothetical protein SAMN04488124_1207 [Halogeometricum limi]